MSGDEFGRVVIYSIVGCKHCRRAKALLESEKMEYTNIDVEEHPELRSEMVELSGGRQTVPQIFFNQHHVGGADDFSTSVSTGEAAKLYAGLKGSPFGKGLGWPSIPTESAAPEQKQQLSSSAADTPIIVSCAEDKYASLVERMCDSTNGVPLKRKKKGSFEGRDALAWLQKQSDVASADAACEMLNEMMALRHFVRDGDGDDESFDAQSTYRWLRASATRALNALALSDCTPPRANEIAEDVRRVILSLYDEVLSADGREVDYRAIPTSSRWPAYLEACAELQRVAIHGLSRQEKTAFFINVYNAMVIHATVERGPPTSMWKRMKFFSSITYRIGGHEYSLQDVENGVLRGNKGGVGQLRVPFGKDDPRRPVALAQCDPRIHAALVCGAKSCPPIRTFRAEHIDEELETCMKGFLQDDSAYHVEDHVVHLSKIFKWYSSDFGKTTRDQLEWIAKYLGENEANKLRALIKSGSYKVSYMKYDWSTNAKKDS